MHRFMLELEGREASFSQTARGLVDALIRTTVAAFANYFDNASLVDGLVGHTVKCSLSRSTRFPATADVSFHVTHSNDFKSISISFDAQILPVFIAFQRNDLLDIPRDQLDVAALRKWCEDKLLAFMDSYLQIETHEQYQRDNYATDPVCGMKVMKSQALSAQHDGRTVYFCAQRCMDRFGQNPAAFGLTKEAR